MCVYCSTCDVLRCSGHRSFQLFITNDRHVRRDAKSTATDSLLRINNSDKKVTSNYSRTLPDSRKLTRALQRIRTRDAAFLVNIHVKWNNLFDKYEITSFQRRILSCIFCMCWSNQNDSQKEKRYKELNYFQQDHQAVNAKYCPRVAAVSCTQKKTKYRCDLDL